MIDFGSLFTLPPGHSPAGIAGLTLLHFLWQGAVIAAILALVFEGLRKSTPSARYAVGVVGMVAMLAAPVVTAVAIVRAPAALPVAAASSDVDAREDMSPAIGAVDTASDGASGVDTSPAASDGLLAGAPIEAVRSWLERVAWLPPALGGFWALGAVIGWIRLAMHVLYAAGMRRAYAVPATRAVASSA